MGKLLVTTLAGIYAAMLIGGRDLPMQDTQIATAKTAPIEAPQVAQASAAPLYSPAKITASANAAPQIQKATLVAPLGAPVARPVDRPVRMPGPALKPSPEYRTIQAAPEGAGGALWKVSANALNVRSGPSTGNAAIDRITRGEEVLVVAERDGWAHVKIEGDGVDGWVAKRYLSPAN